MRLLSIFLLMFSCVAYGQELNNPNRLPLCQGNFDNKFRSSERIPSWDNCWGRVVFAEYSRSYYHGEWKGGRPFGLGTFSLSVFGDDEIVVTGAITEIGSGGVSGKIKQFISKKFTYEGEMKLGERHGFGSFTHPNGNRYRGYWQNDSPHGQGIFTYADGRESEEGYFTKGRLVKAGKVTFVNQNQVDSVDIKSNPNATTGKNDIERDRQQRAEERRRIEEDSRRKEQQATIERERQQLVEERRRTEEDSRRKEQQAIIERERQQLAEERRRLEEEKRQQQAEINNQNKQPVVTDPRRRFALVIGNSAYKRDSNFPPIPNAVNDARVISESLRSAGFRVSTYENLDHASMRNVIRIFGERLGKNDVGLVYYAGHGVQVKGKNYLIPVGTNIKKSFEVPSSAVDVEFLSATLEHIKNDLNIIVLDACRNSFSDERGATQGLAPIEAAKGTFIAFSTAPGKSAQDGAGSNSPYTKHLARLISKKGLPLEQVFKEVRKAVVDETNGEQVPWENSSLMGDFYFVK